MIKTVNTLSLGTHWLVGIKVNYMDSEYYEVHKQRKDCLTGAS